MLNDVDPRGYLPLREAIAKYLSVVRGLACTANNVVVTGGGFHGIDFVMRLGLDPGDTVWTEEAPAPEIYGMLEANGLLAVDIPVDSHELDVTEGHRQAPHTRLVIVTPAHQHPLDMTMSASPRRELLDWAKDSQVWILEDDYDGEFRDEGAPLATLKSLDQDDQVIYVGTFSKSIFPSLRMRYLIMPNTLVGEMSGAREVLDNHPSILEQPVMASFIGRGHFAAYLRRMRQVYRLRHSVLVSAFKAKLNDWIRIEPTETGLHAMGAMTPELLKRMSIDDLLNVAAEAGVVLVPLRASYRDGRDNGGLVLGFASLPEDAIRTAVDILAAAIQQAVRAGQPQTISYGKNSP